MVDNVIVCQELLHSIKRRQGRREVMVLKLDLAKEYDKLEWSFIHDMLLDASLLTNLIAIIIKCITSWYCRLLWNGEVTDPIQPSYQLHQGDLMSPYLFVLCMEKFAQWIESKKESNAWKPIKASRRGPNLSHLFFVDDVLLLTEATENQVDLIKHGLEQFCSVLGQWVSSEKSHLFFSLNVTKEEATNFSTSLGVPQIDDLGKYLG